MKTRPRSSGSVVIATVLLVWAHSYSAEGQAMQQKKDWQRCEEALQQGAYDGVLRAAKACPSLLSRRNRCGWSLLHLMAKGRMLTLERYLEFRALGAPANPRTSEGLSLLALCLTHACEVAQHMLLAGEKLSQFEEAAAIIAGSSYFLSPSDPFKRPRVPRSACIERLRQLLKETPFLPRLFGYPGVTLLHCAVDANDVKFSAFLIEKGADVNALTFCGQSALGIATMQGADGQAVRKLLAKAGARSTRLDDLASAIAGEDETQVSSLLGLDPHLVHRYHPNGPWLCLAAVSNRGTAVMRALLAAGAHVDDSSDAGLTALHIAVKPVLCSPREAEAKVELLLAHGSDVNRGNWYGLTALQMAASSPSSTAQMSALLLERGADPLAEDRGGKTALSALEVRAAADPDFVAILRLAKQKLRK